jgi:hypothetical protein
MTASPGCRRVPNDGIFGGVAFSTLGAASGPLLPELRQCRFLGVAARPGTDFALHLANRSG